MFVVGTAFGFFYTLLWFNTSLPRLWYVWRFKTFLLKGLYLLCISQIIITNKLSLGRQLNWIYLYQNAKSSACAISNLTWTIFARMRIWKIWQQWHGQEQLKPGSQEHVNRKCIYQKCIFLSQSIVMYKSQFSEVLYREISSLPRFLQHIWRSFIHWQVIGTII